MEQLLYATAHAQWMPAMDTLLFPSTVSPGKNLLFAVCGKSDSCRLNGTKPHLRIHLF